MSGRAGRLHAQLSARDLFVLRSLAHLRLLTGRQLQRLHIADGSPLTQARRTRATMQRLTRLQLVARLPRRIGGVHAGSAGYVYGLSGLGQAVLGIDGPYGQRRRSVWETKPAFQDHMLAVAELYVRLAEIAREDVAEVLAFEVEPACWRHHLGAGGHRVTLKPDAYIQLGVGDVELSAFIEQDQATESLPTVKRKCQRYIDYWHSGQEQQQRGVFPRVWWLVPSPHRLRGIIGVLQRLATSAGSLFTVALSNEAPELLTQPPMAAETEA